VRPRLARTLAVVALVAYTRRGEERRKGLGFTFTSPTGNVSYWDSFCHCWLKERRSGKDRRVRPYRRAIMALDPVFYAPLDDVAVAAGDACPRCGAYGGVHQLGRANTFCECQCHEPLSDDEDDYTGPSFRRDKHQYARLGVHSREGKRGRFRDWWRRTIRRRVPVFREYMAGPRLQWGAQSGTSVGAGSGGTGSVRVGPQVHGERLQQLANRERLRPMSHVRILKP